MSTIESSIGNVTTNNNVGYKTFVVDDPTEDIGIQNKTKRVHRTFESTSSDADFYNQAMQNDNQVKEQEIPKKVKTEQNNSNNDDNLSKEQLIKKICEARNSQKIINKDRKSKIEALLGLKRIKESVEIDGHIIVLQNLCGSDMAMALDIIGQISKNYLEQIFDARHVYLAMSLYSIDGEKISDLLGEDDNFQTRLSIIENMTEDALRILHDIFDNKINVKLPTNQKEAEEVASDIKKS